MSDPKNASKLSVIASKCALFCIGAFMICFFSCFAGGMIGILIGIVSGVAAFLTGVGGLTSGIIALCRLTPEEKQERVWSSGTTKNLAMAGIVMPLAIVATVSGWIFFIVPMIK